MHIVTRAPKHRLNSKPAFRPEVPGRSGLVLSKARSTADEAVRMNILLLTPLAITDGLPKEL